MKLTIQLKHQYHEQFEFPLDHHPAQPKFLNFFHLVVEYQQLHLAAIQEEETPTKLLS